MRTIYLIRHGKPEFPDERKYCIGRTDLPLSEEGRTQIRALGETFAGRRIEKIYTSPLKRCRELAAILQEVIDRSIPIEVVDGLAEIDMGNGMVIPSMKSGNSFQRSMWHEGQICTISDRRRERVLQIVRGAPGQSGMNSG